MHKKYVKRRKEDGRPLIPIDWPMVDEMLRHQCTGVEVAARLGMHPETFYNRIEKERGIGFTEYAQEKRSQGVTLLREKQLEVAMSGDKTMLIWLGKQYVNQREPTEKQQAEFTTEQVALIKSIFAQIAQLQHANALITKAQMGSAGDPEEPKSK